MTATSALEKVGDLVEVASQRLIPQALQRLTITEILGNYVLRSPLTIPTKDDLGVAVELESAFNRLVKFLRLHEPTGHEKDIAHKRDVVRFLALTRMLHECQAAKLPQVQTACTLKVLQWFEDSSASNASSGIIGSLSTPILPPRMSPKKTKEPTEKTTMSKSASQDVLPPSGSVDVMVKAAVAEKLAQYKKPDLRASHIRRVAALRSRGADVPEEDLEIPSIPTGPEDTNGDGDEIPKPGDYEKRDRYAKIKATFQSYEPETEAEFAMNQMWLERQRDEEIEKQKAQDVRGKLHKWSINKSREESEYLRKHEAMQLAAGLDKLVEAEYNVLDQPRRGHLAKKKQEWLALQQSAPLAVAAAGVNSANNGSPRKEGDVYGCGEPATPSRYGNSGAISVLKKKSTMGGGNAGPGTPVGSGGMHFRNQLPANYTPQSKRSNGSSTPPSFSSKNSKSNPSTPLSSSSSGKLELLDEAAARGERGAFGANALLSSDDSPEVRDDDDDDEQDNDRVKEPNQHQPQLKFSERIEKPRQELKFQPFHAVNTHMQQSGLPLTRVVSASAINRKLFPRGTLAPQPEPLDPEYRHLYAAATARKPPYSSISIVPEKPPSGPPKKPSTAASNQHEPQVRPRTSTAAVPPGSKRPPPPSSDPLASGGNSGHLVSDLRAEQMNEVERIRALFERHKLRLPSEILERGLLVPEDKSALECAQNLPLPGCGLIGNPLLVGKSKLKKTTKKKKKKKGSKSGDKKTKTKKAPGDKSPKKKKK